MFFGGKHHSSRRSAPTLLLVTASVVALAAHVRPAEAQEKGRAAFFEVARAAGRSVPERIAMAVAAPMRSVEPTRDLPRPAAAPSSSASSASGGIAPSLGSTTGEPVRIDPLDPRGADAVRAFGRRGEATGKSPAPAPGGRSVADLVLKSTPIGAIVRGISIPTGQPSARALAIHEVRLRPTFGNSAGYGFAATLPF